MACWWYNLQGYCYTKCYLNNKAIFMVSDHPTDEKLLHIGLIPFPLGKIIFAVGLPAQWVDPHSIIFCNIRTVRHGLITLYFKLNVGCQVICFVAFKFFACSCPTPWGLGSAESDHPANLTKVHTPTLCLFQDHLGDSSICPRLVTRNVEFACTLLSSA